MAGTEDFIHVHARRTTKDYNKGARTGVSVTLSAKLTPTDEGGDDSPNTMAIVKGWEGHVLYDKIMPGSTGCGLVRTLIYALFNDPLITARGGFLHGMRTGHSSFDQFPALKRQAQENCDVMVEVNFSSRRWIAHERGDSYLRGAFYAFYEMVFLYKAGRKGNPAQMVVDNLVAKTPEFGESPQAFTEKYGSRWFFCHCKMDSDDTRRRCWEMN